MKFFTNLIILIALLLCFFSGFSQINATRKVRIGLEFAPNLGFFSPNIDGFNSSGTELGYKLGTVIEFLLSDNYLLSTGLYLGNHGGEISYNGVYNSGSKYISTLINSAYEISYIELPLFMKLRTNELAGFRYLLFFGTEFLFKYAALDDIDYKDIQNGISKEDVKVASDIFLFNPNLVMGLGAEYNIFGNTSIFAGLSYSKGLISPLDFKQYQYDSKNKVIFDANGNPQISSKKTSALLNYFTLHLGIFF